MVEWGSVTALSNATTALMISVGRGFGNSDRHFCSVLLWDMFFVIFKRCIYQEIKMQNYVVQNTVYKK